MFYIVYHRYIVILQWIWKTQSNKIYTFYSYFCKYTEVLLTLLSYFIHFTFIHENTDKTTRPDRTSHLLPVAREVNTHSLGRTPWENCRFKPLDTTLHRNHLSGKPVNSFSLRSKLHLVFRFFVQWPLFDAYVGVYVLSEPTRAYRPWGATTSQGHVHRSEVGEACRRPEREVTLRVTTVMFRITNKSRMTTVHDII